MCVLKIRDFQRGCMKHQTVSYSKFYSSCANNTFTQLVILGAGVVWDVGLVWDVWGVRWGLGYLKINTEKKWFYKIKTIVWWPC